MAQARDTLLNDLLRDTSRSFFLTLRVLPKSIRPQIGLAYLLARTTDTIADTELVPLAKRLESLQLLRERIAGRAIVKIDFKDLAAHQASAAERALLERVEESLSLLSEFDPADRDRIREVLETITSGQTLDLERFAGASTQSIRALSTPQELDDYTFRVAGCVGRFWTKMCLAHVFRLKGASAADVEIFEALGVQFGKGLQLVNILRDIPSDLKQGRCYIPSESLNAAGLSASDLLNPANEGKFRVVYDPLLDQARSKLLSGWEYTNRIPRTQVRIRLACAWPILIGLQTLKLLQSANVLDPTRRVKIDRGQVRSTILRSVALYPLPGAWKKLADTV